MPPPPAFPLEQEDDSVDAVLPQAPSTPTLTPKWPTSIMKAVILELRKQRAIAVPLVAMNLTWFSKTAITTAFLGRLGEIQLAGGILGFTFANVTGFSVLIGLCGAMEPICGQAYGAKNYKLLHKTLLMTTLLLLVTAIPISFLWLHVDKILVCVGQQKDVANLARTYVVYLLPDLVVTSFLCPLKAYLSSQGVTLPILFSSATALAIHVPINILLAEVKGLKGVAMAIWLTDLSLVIMLAIYVLASEWRKGRTKIWWEEDGGGWWDQRASDWVRLLRLSGPCCLTTCLEWWCFEILILLAGRLSDGKRMVAVLAVVLNFDYLLFSVMLSLSTCASTRISNELGAGQALASRESARVSLGLSFISGCLGGAVMLTVGRYWGTLFSHDKGFVDGVGRMMVLMGVTEVVNFPLGVCGGIVRGTARPWLGMYASFGGFYLVALPLAVVLAFRVGVGLGLRGLLLGFLGGSVVSLVSLLVLVSRIDWIKEARKAQELVGASEGVTCVSCSKEAGDGGCVSTDAVSQIKI